MDSKIAHLGFIQDVISRMDKNSFLLKGWAIALVTGLFALGSKADNVKFVWMSGLLVIIFWSLDAYYLWQERLYRRLYEKAAEGSPETEPFTMDASVYKEEVGCYFRTARSKPLLILYSALLIADIALLICFHHQG